MRACVLGSGPFGTALANNLAVRCGRVWLWGRDADLIEHINRQHENRKYLPGISLLPNIRGTLSLPEALNEADIIVLAVPSHSLPAVMSSALPYLPANVPVVVTSKSFEDGKNFLISDLLKSCLPSEFHPCIDVLSGPSFAKELARRQPTFLVIAALREDVALRCQQLLQTDTLQLRVNMDIIGVQVGAALKNVISIAAGICDGLHLGPNMKAALITWGLEEIARLAVHLGADSHTVYGVSGIGDLILTSAGASSRSWQVGFELAKGCLIDDVLAKMGKEMIEGVKTARNVMVLAQREGVDMPICSQVFHVINGKDASLAMQELQRGVVRWQ
jgi:glycerol-3-phosphate dehydrogenase (NAD(P)+)